jgi:hypothetical protein
MASDLEGDNKAAAVVAVGSLVDSSHPASAHTRPGDGSTTAVGTSLAGPARDSGSWEAAGNSTFSFPQFKPLSDLELEKVEDQRKRLFNDSKGRNEPLTVSVLNGTCSTF